MTPPTSTQPVVDEVTRVLGPTPRAVKTEAINLFGNSYRINIWCSPASSTGNNVIAHSYYIRMSEGKIVYSNPELKPSAPAAPPAPAVV